jgi:tryptophan-rich sensory protein
MPPDATIGIIWTALYGAMAVSAWRVAREAGRRPDGPTQKVSSRYRRRALALWLAQLGLNAAWSPIFFGARRPRLALLDVAAQVPLVAAYVGFARRVDRAAAWLMVPTLAWLGFATLLNAEIVRRNRHVTFG